MVESKGSNQGLLDALIDLETEDGDEYFVAFDYVVDNQDIRNKYRMLKSITGKSEGKIVILDMICFEYLILAFDKLVEWTETGKTDKIKIRDKVLAAVENHRIDLSRIVDKKTLQYIAGFKRYSTERVMKSLVGEFTQNEKWSVKGTLMGECWYKDCCVSEHTDNLRCGKYVNATPLARLEKLYQQYNVPITRQNMANWTILCAERYLSVLYDYLHKYLYRCHVIQADETPLLVNKDGRPAGSKSYMWVYRTGKYQTDRQVILYDYQKTRKADHPREFLKDFRGVCVTDTKLKKIEKSRDELSCRQSKIG